MGLDMYLHKKHYVKNWEHKGKEGQFSFLIKKGGKKVDYINTKKICYIEEEVAYWRKANQIHNWFIKNCANGDGERATMNVSRDQLVELLGIVNKVLKASKLVKGKIKNGQTGTKDGWVDNMVDGKYIEDSSVAEELLPTASGFFFGGTDYDEYYIEDLKHTKQVLEEELKATEGDKSYLEYEYYASW